MLDTILNKEHRDVIEYCIELRTRKEVADEFGITESEAGAIFDMYYISIDHKPELQKFICTEKGKIAIKQFDKENKLSDKEIIWDTIQKVLELDNPVNLNQLDSWKSLTKEDHKRIKRKLLLDANLIREAPYNKMHIYYQPRALKVRKDDIDKDGNYTVINELLKDSIDGSSRVMKRATVWIAVAGVATAVAAISTSVIAYKEYNKPVQPMIIQTPEDKPLEVQIQDTVPIQNISNDTTIVRIDTTVYR